jgi:hypothetical protein
MKQNLYSGAHLVLKDGNPLEELRFGKSNLPALSSSTGEINANSTADLCQQIAQMMKAVASGQIVPVEKSALSASEEYTNELQKRREVLAAAYNDTTGNSWASLGAALALQLQEQRNREGFMRRISVGQTLKQGEIARVSMTAWDAVAVVATSAANIGFQVIRHKNFQPDEFEVNANLRVEQLEIEQVSGDILEDVYNQGLDAIMVQEDRLWKRSADLCVGVVNPLQYISGQLSPGMLARIRNGVTDWNLPATTALLSNDFWADIIGSPDFGQFLDPVNKYDLVLNGYLGTLAGLNLITDAFRQPNQKVLSRGELYVIATPENHAAYTDRGGIRATPTSGADAGNTTRGWLMSEMLTFILANPRSVSKGVRI